MDNKRILIVEDDDSLRHIMHDNFVQCVAMRFWWRRTAKRV